MATTHHPITVPSGRRQVGLDTPTRPAALHLVDGRWIASCADCGCELAAGWHQGKVEARAARRSCPVCAEVT